MGNNWNAAIEADLNSVEFGSREDVKDGVYPAIISDARHEKFKTGSEGLKVTFTINTPEYKNRQIREYIVLKSAAGTLVPLGGAKAKRLAMACGLTAEQINKFSLPDAGSSALGDLKKFLDAEVVIEVKGQKQTTGLHAGKTFARVNSIKQKAA